MKENKKPKSCARCACFTANFHTHSGKCSKLGRIDTLIACASFVDYHEAKEVAKNKYHREIKKGVFVDVYDVLKAFDVTCPAMQHAIKKMLASGKRGVKDSLQDKQEAIDSIQRSIEIEKEWQK